MLFLHLCVYLARVTFCLLVFLGVGSWLRLVFAALPGLFIDCNYKYFRSADSSSFTKQARQHDLWNLEVLSFVDFDLEFTDTDEGL